MAAAAYILCQLAGAPFEGESVIQLTAQQYDRALIRLQQREEEVFHSTEALPVDRDDVSSVSWSGGGQLHMPAHSVLTDIVHEFRRI